MKILLAFDDSKFSQAALKMLIEQNNAAKTQVRVLYVVEPLEVPYYPEIEPPYPTSIDDINRDRVKSGREMVKNVVERLRSAGFKADALVLTEHARPAIVDQAAKWHADLIMLGSHGRHGLERLLLGSVSDYVARHATCSVQIIRLRKRS